MCGVGLWGREGGRLGLDWLGWVCGGFRVLLWAGAGLAGLGCGGWTLWQVLS